MIKTINRDQPGIVLPRLLARKVAERQGRTGPSVPLGQGELTTPPAPRPPADRSPPRPFPQPRTLADDDGRAESVQPHVHTHSREEHGHTAADKIKMKTTPNQLPEYKENSYVTPAHLHIKQRSN